MNALLKKGEIGFCALGGLSEVGKNTYVFEIENQIFLIDAGILFPDNSLLGVDYIIPSYEYLKQNEHKIVGLFITHGHEDHIGGIPYLLKQVNIKKIYAAGIAVDLISFKFNDHPEIAVPQIEEFKAHYTYQFNNVKVSFIRLNHSIPDMFGIVLHTEYGPIFFTGDFKIDFTPVGPSAEYDKLIALKQEKCLLLLSDSTNAEREGIIKSEGIVGRSIMDLFDKIEGRIIIVTFASNLYRIQQIIEATIHSNRKIVIFGRSMERAIEAGIHSGYINVPPGTIIDSEHISSVEASQLVVLATGSQGEPLAALSRIASGSHRYIKTTPHDTVIFSSSPIPGNQEGINTIINKLFKQGVDVIVNSPITDTHASGHAAQHDLKMMISLVRPKFFIPVHGEHKMLKIHQKLAIECRIPEENTLVLDNGQMVAITNEYIRVVGEVACSEIYIDGAGVGDVGNKVLKERHVLSQEGLFSVVCLINSAEKILMQTPSIISRGFIYVKGSVSFTTELVKNTIDILNQELQNSDFNETEVIQKIKVFLEEKITQLTLRYPLVMPIIIDLAK